MDFSEQNKFDGIDNEEFKKQFGTSYKEFQNLFKDFEDYFKLNPNKKIDGKNIITSLNLTFEESINGNEKEISYSKFVVCTKCNGSKCKEGTLPSVCKKCNGTGEVKNEVKDNMGNISDYCDECYSKGEIIDYPCLLCFGEGIEEIFVEENINIMPGINSGNNLRYKNKGNIGQNGGSFGDLIVKINVNNDTFFKRNNFNIHTNCYITISQAVLGCKIKIKTIYGQEEIEIPKLSYHGKQIQLDNKGIRNLPPNDNKYGSHIVTLKVLMPKNLTPKEISLFEDLNRINKSYIEEIQLKNLDKDKKNLFSKFQIWKD